MDDAFGVGGVEAAGDLDAEFEQAGEIHGFAGDGVLESMAFEQFHGDKRAAFEFADVVNGADVRVVQGRGGAGFSAETFDGLWILRNIVGKKFEGDGAAEAGVPRFVDNAHATTAQFAEHAVMRNVAPEHGRSVRHWTWSLAQGLVRGKHATENQRLRTGWLIRNPPGN